MTNLKARVHGFADVKKRVKWCAECSQWIKFSQWTKHQINRHPVPEDPKDTGLLVDRVKKVYERINNSVNAHWREVPETNQTPVSYKELYEETVKKFQAEQVAARRLSKENSQLRRVICEQARVIVETYSEYN